jgi:hypothetical protein
MTFDNGLTEWDEKASMNGCVATLPSFPRAKIVIFDDVQNGVEAGDVLWMRFETLPVD